MDYDILISGAGPAGLCLARALSGCGLTIGIADPQPLAALENPAYDGREIALTQRSAHQMRVLGLWGRIEGYEATAFSPLRDAQVLDGLSPYAMRIEHSLSRHSELGWLVSNHLIRRAAFAELRAAQDKNGDITLLAGESVAHAHTDAEGAHVRLASGKALSARLLIAADSRFSGTRRAMGIGADMHDFGRSMLLCTMTHQEPHHQVAWEWFGYGQTLALLPMNDAPESGAHRSCVVLTLPHHQLEALEAMEAPEFGRALTAAVGMHPVTAHGFNFGLLGISALAEAIRTAQSSGDDIAAPRLLAQYERGHRRATLPLYLATNFVAQLYTADAGPARLLRGAALRLAQNFPPFKRAVAASLSGGH